SEAWASALVAFDRDLRRRGAAEKTRRAYGVDLDQFARWAGGRGLAPETVSVRGMRRYAAGLSQRGGAASTVARKLASLRAVSRLGRRSGPGHGQGWGDPEATGRGDRGEGAARLGAAEPPGAQSHSPLRRAGTAGRARAVPVEVGAAPLDLRRAPPAARLGPARGGAGRGLSALATPLLRHPFARGRSRFAGDSGAFGTCVALDNSGLHSSRVRQAEDR